MAASHPPRFQWDDSKPNEPWVSSWQDTQVFAVFLHTNTRSTIRAVQRSYLWYMWFCVWISQVFPCKLFPDPCFDFEVSFKTKYSFSLCYTSISNFSDGSASSLKLECEDCKMLLAKARHETKCTRSRISLFPTWFSAHGRKSALRAVRSACVVFTLCVENNRHIKMKGKTPTEYYRTLAQCGHTFIRHIRYQYGSAVGTAKPGLTHDKLVHVQSFFCVWVPDTTLAVPVHATFRKSALVLSYWILNQIWLYRADFP